MPLIKYILLLVFLSLTLAGLQNLRAQGCTEGLLLQPGTMLEYKTYKNKKKKPLYTARHQVTKIEVQDDRVLAHLKCAFYNKKGRLERSFDYFIGCKEGKMIMDKEVLSDPENLTLFEDKEFNFDGKNIHYPATASAGDTLRSAHHTVEVTTGSVNLATITTSISERKVIGKQKVETPAGTFDAYKISYLSSLTRGSNTLSFTRRQRIVEYIVPNLGLVRSEILNKKLKVKQYTQLEKLVHPKNSTPAPKL